MLQPLPPSKKIILLGSGHSHLEVLKLLSRDEITQNQFVLISPEKYSHYTGLIPRFIAGDLKAKDLTIPSASFAENKGIQFIQDSAVFFDEVQKTVTLASGKVVSFDYLSINIGGVQFKETRIDSEISLYLRPFADFLQNWQLVEKKLASHGPLSFAVIGGGAAAVEVATTLQILLNRSGRHFQSKVFLITKSQRLCPNYSERISKILEQNIQRLGIIVYYDQEVLRSGPKVLHLKDNISLEIDQVFLATPTVPSQLDLRKSNVHLQISPSIFAAGDCVLMENYPQLPRSGVIAVHQGRHLAKNIQKILAGQELIRYHPSTNQLNILICGPKTALAVWGKWSYQGYLPWLLKNWIDKRYMRSFQTGF